MGDELHVVAFRPDRPGIRKILGDLETEIMESIWARPQGQGTTVRDVFEVLYARRRLAYTTVMNTMTRLASKGLLRTEKLPEGARHGYVYYPIYTEEELVSRFVGRILEDLVANFGGAMARELRRLKDPTLRQRAERLLAELDRRRASERT